MPNELKRPTQPVVPRPTATARAGEVGVKVPEYTGQLSTEAERKEHARRMAIDRDYAQAFLARSFGAGQVFTVVLECVDPLAVQALFKAIQTCVAAEKAKEGAVVPTIEVVAGCKVMAIVDHNLLAKTQAALQVLSAKT